MKQLELISLRNSLPAFLDKQNFQIETNGPDLFIRWGSSEDQVLLSVDLAAGKGSIEFTETETRKVITL